MTTGPAPDDRAEAPLFADGIGERVVVADGATGELLQILRLRPALTAVPSFEFALRERAARLANFRHAYYARVRRIDRVAAPGTGLAIVSDHLEGTRLSDLLRVAHERNLRLDVNTALCLIRQAVAAVALLHENAREVAHGLIAPERLLVTPHARLIVVEHVLAAAIEQLQFGRDRLWREFRIALPPSAGLPRFDHRADVTGVGLVALGLLLGRPLDDEEFPQRVGELLNQTRERSALGDDQPLSAPLRTWLARALQLDPRRAFASAPEALAALDDVFGDGSMYVSAPVALETFLSRYAAALLEPAPVDVVKPSAWLAPVAVEPLAPAPPPTPYQEPAPAVVSAPAPRTVMPVDAWTPTVVAPKGPDFADFRLELERDAEMAKASPVRHVTQHSAPAKREGPARPLRDAPPREGRDGFGIRGSGLGITESGTARSRDIRGTPKVGDDSSSFAEDPHEALAGPWRELAARPVSEPAPATSSDTAERSGPSFGDFDGPASADLRAVTARDIEDLISTQDLVPPQEERGVPVAVEEPAGRGGNPWFRTAALLLIILALAGGGVFASRYYTSRAIPASPAMGTLVVQSRPAGVQVVVDGVDRGMTPARLSVTPGAHILELRGRGTPRVIPINVVAGTQVSHYVEFADRPATGRLTVQSQPAGARVVVDGVERGIAPLTVEELSPGDHEVLFQTDAGTVRHVVTVQAGATASIVAPVAGGGPVSGWVTIKAPFAVEVHEQGRMLGTSETERLMMAAGRHELELVNDTLGYRVTRAVQVQPGKVVSLAVDLPQGVVHLNATPWAEVWIDGAKVGDTPIGNLAVAIGSHEVVFRHPQLGEKRHAISVTLSAPVRVSVDMR
jgi:hypothetical protein